MSNQNEIEKEHSRYLGDVVGSLMREAAYWKAKFSVVQAENQSLQNALQQQKQNENHYINQEHTKSHNAMKDLADNQYVDQ